MSVKMNFSLDAQVADTLKQRARELGKPASRYVSDLVERDVRSAREELAAEGYRELAGVAESFSEAALPAASETWAEWTGEQ